MESCQEIRNYEVAIHGESKLEIDRLITKHQQDEDALDKIKENITSKKEEIIAFHKANMDEARDIEEEIKNSNPRETDCDKLNHLSASRIRRNELIALSKKLEEELKGLENESIRMAEAIKESDGIIEKSKLDNELYLRELNSQVEDFIKKREEVREYIKSKLESLEESKESFKRIDAQPEANPNIASVGKKQVEAMTASTGEKVDDIFINTDQNVENPSLNSSNTENKPTGKSMLKLLTIGGLLLAGLVALCLFFYK